VHPEGKARLYADGRFNTATDICESYGHDIETGAALTAEQYRAIDLDGRAHIKSADYSDPKETPDRQYPLWLTTGRIVHHWHTRTKTGRSPDLDAAAPEVFVEINPDDAANLRISDGDTVEVVSRRGRIEGHAKLGEIARGVVFVPFHYGDWDAPGRRSAANFLTITDWDPISHQPHFKYAAVRVRKLPTGTRSGKERG
jgi:anaerobic selenocysteine-containing dehydrogenase